MRRKALIFFAILLSAILCGCNNPKEINGGNNKYLISSLGFDRENDKLVLSLEAVIINSDDLNAQKQKSLLIGKGDTINEALFECKSKATMDAELSHTAVAVIGDGIFEKRFNEICEFLLNERKITLSVLLVRTNNAKELLEEKSISSVAVGYDITDMIEQYEFISKKSFNNHLYEMFYQRKRELPFIELQSDGFFINGTQGLDEKSLAVNLN